MSMEKLIQVAKGEAAADLILANARVVNTLSGEIEEGSVAIYGERIAGTSPAMPRWWFHAAFQP
jgi:adenine deaminase